MKKAAKVETANWIIGQDQIPIFLETAERFRIKFLEMSGRPGDIVEVGAGEVEVSADMIALKVEKPPGYEPYYPFAQAVNQAMGLGPKG